MKDFKQMLSESASAAQWNKVGLCRRSGLMAPLFSVYSENSVGIADFSDLNFLGQICKKMGSSILQLLPLNDSGYGFMPYDSQSSFALDPMYLPLTNTKCADFSSFQPSILDLKNAFPIDPYRVNYGIKAKKMELLWEVFQVNKGSAADRGFWEYRESNSYWVEDYALFKVLQQVTGKHDWQEWPREYRDRDENVLSRFSEEHNESLLFHVWLQYLCFQSLNNVRTFLNQSGVLLMGDLPFLVSRSSADVWAFRECFKLELSSGAPPDYFLAAGQRWGMPPYDWNRLKADDYRYIKSKLAYASNFYNMYRIDHAIGLFRVWTIRNTEPFESAGLNGVFDPPDEAEWQQHGEQLFRMMLHASEMLPCAEDLGMVPACSEPTLASLGIPGMEVYRWTEENNHAPSLREQYRLIASAVLSTHDTLPVSQWWHDLAEEERLNRAVHLGLSGSDAPYTEVLQKSFEFISETASVFTVHSIQDVLNFTSPELQEHCMRNINYPGTFGDMNWTWRCPVPLEKWADNSSFNFLRDMNARTGRI